MINRKQGFTLIELIVVVAIIGVISAVAFPSYDSYMTKARRADAKTALSNIADRQERHYLQLNTYSATLGALNVAGVSDEGYYTLTINSGNVNTFKATAVAVSTTDTLCKYMTIDSIGAKNAGAAADPVGDLNNCW